MILNIISNWRTSVEDKTDRIEIYNYGSKEDFETFISETDNNEELKNCFQDENGDLELALKRWLSIVNKNIKKCFKKIRIKRERKNIELEKLFAQKDELKIKLAEADDSNSDMDELKDEIETITDQIADLVGEKRWPMTSSQK